MADLNERDETLVHYMSEVLRQECGLEAAIEDRIAMIELEAAMNAHIARAAKTSQRSWRRSTRRRGTRCTPFAPGARRRSC